MAQVLTPIEVLKVFHDGDNWLASNDTEAFLSNDQNTATFIDRKSPAYPPITDEQTGETLYQEVITTLHRSQVVVKRKLVQVGDPVDISLTPVQ